MVARCTTAWCRTETVTATALVDKADQIEFSCKYWQLFRLQIFHHFNCLTSDIILTILVKMYVRHEASAFWGREFAFIRELSRLISGRTRLHSRYE